MAKNDILVHGKVKQIADAVGGKIEEAGILPDDSGYALMSMPLPEDHWIYGDPELAEGEFEPPPMTMRMGTDNVDHAKTVKKIWKAGMYAVRAATMKGKERGFDPDALVQNLVVGLLGYFTPDGLNHEDDWANPKELRHLLKPEK